jgi:hypothetical protein
MQLFLRRAAIAAALVLSGLTAAYAGKVKYAAKLDGASETPPNDSKGTGMVAAQFDTATKTLSWTVTYSGLKGRAIAAHFHGAAPAGKSALVMVPVRGNLASPIRGSARLTKSQEKALTAGMMYFNIYTAAHKPGEIRGQLMMGM